MNFSNRSKLSKVLSLILVCVLMLTLFAGCKKEEPEETTESTIGLGLNLSPTNPPETTEPPVPEETEPEENMGTLLEDTPIRGTPSTQAAELVMLKKGARVRVDRIEEVGPKMWGYVKQHDGWIEMSFVAMDDPNATGSVGSNETPAGSGNVAPPPQNNDTPATGTSKGVVTGTTLNIRSGPSTSDKVVGSYVKGDVITLLEQKNGWGKTDKGWVNMDHVKITSGAGATGSNGTTTGGSNVTGNGNTTVVAKGVVRAKELNVRASASTNSDKVASVKYGDRVEILEKSGSWGRIEQGWIHLDYVYQDGSTGTNTAKGTVTTTLRIRSGPGTGYDAVGSYASGTSITVLEQFTYSNTTWGCTSKGWISMDYVNVNGTTGGTTTSNTGTITDDLNVREGAGTGYAIIGEYFAGDVVTILERNNGWGRTDKGWISLNYVDFSSSGTTTSTSDVGTVTDDLNVRQGAGTGYAIIGEYWAGDVVTILERSNGWGRTDKGWISLNYVDFTNTGSGQTGTVTTGLNVRSGPGTGYDKVGTLTSGTRVTILKTENGWGQIGTGWISMNYVDLD